MVVCAPELPTDITVGIVEKDDDVPPAVVVLGGALRSTVELVGRFAFGFGFGFTRHLEK